MALTFELVDNPAAFRRAADALARGRGPFALDTERASAFRYDDRAFLVQVHRRDAGTFLIAPEGHRDAVRAIFAPVLSGRDWLIHAAGEDLPSLAALGLAPGRLFDTELAGRLGGFDRPNLAAMVEHFVGVHLAKGHGREDWSTTPLPMEWQEYAALDVVHLNDLAEAQAEFLDSRGLLDCASQEFEHIVSRRLSPEAPGPEWSGMKGVAALRSASQLQVARALWTARDDRGRATDTAPGALLPNRVLLELARAQPRTAQEITRVKGFPRRRAGAARECSKVIREALSADPATWPDRAELRNGRDGVPGKGAWERNHPESWAALQASRDAVAAAATEIGMEPATLLQPAVLRETVWHVTSAPALHGTHEIAAGLIRLGARPWQAEITAPALSRALQAAGFSP